jgi:hypothetical protein
MTGMPTPMPIFAPSERPGEDSGTGVFVGGALLVGVVDASMLEAGGELDANVPVIVGEEEAEVRRVVAELDFPADGLYELRSRKPHSL